MADNADKIDPKEERQKVRQAGRGRSSNFPKGGEPEGKRTRIRKPVQEASPSAAKRPVRQGHAGRKETHLSGTIEGLDLREVFRQWHEFAKAKGYLLVTGRRRFISDLDRVNTCIEEEESLFAFCRTQGISFARRMPVLLSGPPAKAGAEHSVYLPLEKESQRVTKITHPGKYGRMEHTPFLYLERSALCNDLFPGLDIRFEDCIKTANGEYSILTTMQYLSGSPPTLAEIDQFLRSIGFSPHSDGSSTIDYRRQDLEIILRDCHPGNWVKTGRGVLLPIDVSPEFG
jgi:hypothetical protein